MTLSVPYSFVPGTKAKADEVNANFIAILDKIEKSNSDIEELNTTNQTKLNNDLSNLSEEGQEIIDSKADKSEIDGKWVAKSAYIAQAITITENYDVTFNLSSILPDDENVYEVIISVIIRTGTSTNNCTAVFATSALCGTMCLCRAVTRTNSNQAAAGSNIIPVGKDRKIRFFSGSETNSDSTAASCNFRVAAYRKVS
ncbi:hypothetical protein HDR58_10450 [bacterium]|nr:hypothetical protein [bacterium]